MPSSRARVNRDAAASASRQRASSAPPSPIRDTRRSPPISRAPPRPILCEMFDTLSEKLQAALSDVRARGKLNEDDINKAMREIRLALLEADVNFKVVKGFTAALKERALGE